MSCGSAGSCAAGGYYSHGDLGRRGFVAVERDGVWGVAIAVPGLAALNKDDYAEVTSVSCASAGSCTAGGYHTYGGGNEQGFVAVERDGVWGTAIQVPGLAALNTGAGAGVSSVSCVPAGSCTAVGGYTDRRDHSLGFVAVERDGRWGKAIAVPGLAALSKGDAGSLSVSCGSAGSCAAGGQYRNHGLQGFVVVERHGRWGKAIAVPGLKALNTGKLAEATSAVVRLGGQLRRRRVLLRPPSSRPVVRGRRAARPLGHGDPGARPKGAEQARRRRGLPELLLGVLRPRRHLRRRRVLHRSPRCYAGIRHPGQIAPPGARAPRLACRPLARQRPTSSKARPAR